VPELPEVERASRLLRDAAEGRTIVSMRLLHPALSRKVRRARLSAVRGRVIESVERRGKHQLLHLSGGWVVHAHFRMTGGWTFAPSDGPPPTHARARIDLDDHTSIFLSDSRALATLAILASGELSLPGLGPEPTSPEFGAGRLRDALATRALPIKQALLDQRVVAGLGNIYVAEALWQARISPTVPARSLSSPRLELLASAIREVIADALSLADPDSQRFAVYDREGEPCLRCGARIRRIVQGGRSTCFCPRCQRR
jgi:formamidopyrimidine-DNA glycosylase